MDGSIAPFILNLGTDKFPAALSPVKSFRYPIHEKVSGVGFRTNLDILNNEKIRTFCKESNYVPWVF
jgi:hypothetical protein